MHVQAQEWICLKALGVVRTDGQCDMGWILGITLMCFCP